MNTIEKLEYEQYKVEYLKVYRDETVDDLAKALYYTRRYNIRRINWWRNTAIILAIASFMLVLVVS